MNSAERRASALDITAKLEALRERVRDGHESGTLTLAQDQEATAEAESLNQQLQAVLTEGAKPCPRCTHPIVGADGVAKDEPTPAFGLMHESGLGKGKGVRYTFEVGCRNAACRDCRATDLLPELAVERWNTDDYDAPREEAEPQGILDVSAPRAYCVAVMANPSEPSMPPLEIRRWTPDGVVALCWHEAAPQSKLVSFDAEQAAKLPTKLRAEALACLAG